MGEFYFIRMARDFGHSSSRRNFLKPDMSHPRRDDASDCVDKGHDHQGFAETCQVLSSHWSSILPWAKMVWREASGMGEFYFIRMARA